MSLDQNISGRRMRYTTKRMAAIQYVLLSLRKLKNNLGKSTAETLDWAWEKFPHVKSEHHGEEPELIYALKALSNDFKCLQYLMYSELENNFTAKKYKKKHFAAVLDILGRDPADFRKFQDTQTEFVNPVHLLNSLKAFQKIEERNNG